MSTDHPPIYPDEHGDWRAANKGAAANPFQRLFLTRPPERNSEGTRYDVWQRTDECVTFLGTAEFVTNLPAPVGSHGRSSDEGTATAAPDAGSGNATTETEQERKARIGLEAVAFFMAEGER